MIASFRLGSLALAAGALAIAFAAGDLWQWAIAFSALGILAGIGSSRRGSRLGAIGLVICVLAAGIGMVLGLPPFPLLLAVSAALAYWDLDAFQLRLSRVAGTALTPRLEKSHLQRLLSVLVLGMAVSLLALSIRTDLGLLGAMLLVLVVVISLRLGVGALMRAAPSRPSR